MAQRSNNATGSGFLPTDPRGSRKGAPTLDRSQLQGGGGMGFASPRARAGWDAKPRQRGDPYYQAKTEEEHKQRKLDQGIAPTHDNMGSLAVQYRADADTAHAAGDMSVADKRAQKILDARADADYQWNVTDVNRAAERHGQSVMDAQKAFFNKHTYKVPSSSAGLSIGTAVGRTSKGVQAAQSQRRNKRKPVGGATTSLGQGILPGTRKASGGSGVTMAQRKNTNTGDISNIGGQTAHAALPYTQTLARGKESQTGQGGSTGGAFFRG